MADGLPLLRASKARAQEVIEQALREARDLLGLAEETQQLLERLAPEEIARRFEEWTHVRERWDAKTKTALQSVFEGPDLPEEFHEAATGLIFRNVYQDDFATFEYSQEAVRRGINVLESIGDRLEYAEGPAAQQVVQRPAPSVDSSRVFVVHGRDSGLRAEVMNVLTRLGLEPIVLGMEAGRSRTIIEKFEQESMDAAFAVVLLTTDDFGRGPDDSAEWPSAPNRARQNVILELGYFMGALGRNRVVALASPGIEQPSDIHGIEYIPLDAGWQLALARELRAAGLPVNLEGLM